MNDDYKRRIVDDLKLGGYRSKKTIFKNNKVFINSKFPMTPNPNK